MAITRASLNKRFERLAQRMRRCALHGTRLWCLHEVQWIGTEQELEAAVDLGCKLHPYLPQWTLTNQSCPTCGEWLMCEPCAQDQRRGMPPIWIPDDLCTPEEWARWCALKGLFRRTPGEHHTFPPTGYPLPEWLAKRRAASQPIAVPAPLPPQLPTPAPMPTPVPVVPVVAPPPAIQPDNVSLNMPEVIDDDDKIDEATVTALQDLIAQLTDQLKGPR